MWLWGKRRGARYRRLMFLSHAPALSLSSRMCMSQTLQPRFLPGRIDEVPDSQRQRLGGGGDSDLSYRRGQEFHWSHIVNSELKRRLSSKL